MLGRTAMTLMVCAVGLLLAAPSGAGKPQPTVRFLSVSAHAVPGERAQATLLVRPAGVACSLTVRYAGGSTQAGLTPTRAAGGRARWEWRVPEGAKPGNAQLVAACKRAGRASRALPVVGAIIPARISVEKSGFSHRPGSTTGSEISYGVIVRNESPNQDAYNVTVLVNFADDSNRIWGSSSVTVGGIAAGHSHALGNSLTFDGFPPVTRLEIVIQIGGRAPASRRPPVLASKPGVREITVEPSTWEPQWVGAVSGELVNDDRRLILSRASMSAVVLDAFGNIIGGGSGSSYFSLPPSARAVFKLTSGFRAIPTIRAASAVVSSEPAYSQPGS